MKIITTVHKKGFEEYGHRWVDSVPHWPGQCVMYTEGFETDKVETKPVESIKRLMEFKEYYKEYRPPSWRYDIVKFSHKVFAAYDAFYDYDGIGVWLDADAVTYGEVPPGYIESQLDGAYLAHFKRDGWYTETGMWIMDCSKPIHKQFLDTWIEWFESGNFQNLNEWHDCTTLDATIKKLKVETKSLSGEFSKDMHPLAKADLGRYIDHCKGGRKELGFSPENEYRRTN